VTLWERLKRLSEAQVLRAESSWNHWRARAALQQLLDTHPTLMLGERLRLEEDILWRIATNAHVTLGDACHVRRGCEIKADRGARLAIGARVHLGPWSTVSALSEVIIGDDCLIAERVSIRDHDHVFRTVGRTYSEQGYQVEPVIIGRNVWLGAGVTLIKGVELGDHCVVAAHAVVTHSFPPASIVAGVPARLIRRLEA
jgi:acetyltransferase-like isoleucine patch superfamily enzyme